MYTRLLKPSETQSFFLFGARGTGKSTLLQGLSFLQDARYIDLLNPVEEEVYALRPQTLEEECLKLQPGSWVVIDEVQKLPKLLDLVHRLIERRQIRFALSGSSSRKLKRGGANLLAGRAFVFSLFPLLAEELGKDFDLKGALEWGTLPQIFEYQNSQDRNRYLKSYTHTYLKEEVLAEQLIRNLDPFRLFLSVAAQMNTKIINYSNIARDVGTDYKTVQNYFQILEETFIGFLLPSYSKSVRKVQRQNSKFYFFDLGIKRALQNTLSVPLIESTGDYGEAFESFVVNEIHRQNIYGEKDYKLSYLKTKDDVEIDLILERPGQPTALVEIKSSEKIDDRHIKNLRHFKNDFRGSDLICLSRVKQAKEIDGIQVFPWQEGIKELGL